VQAYTNIGELWDAESDCELILIDIPIGLPNGDMPTRNCDHKARHKLGFPRRTSVFSPPGRVTFDAMTHPDASVANRNELEVGLSIQSWAILPKIRQVDHFLAGNNNPARQIIRECHPELCFWGLNRLAHGVRNPVNFNKKTPEGRKARMEILRNSLPHYPADEIYDFATQNFLRRNVARDDIVDAMAAAFTAFLEPNGTDTFPIEAERQMDACGLPMEMVYPI